MSKNLNCAVLMPTMYVSGFHLQPGAFYAPDGWMSMFSWCYLVRIMAGHERLYPPCSLPRWWWPHSACLRLVRGTGFGRYLLRHSPTNGRCSDLAAILKLFEHQKRAVLMPTMYVSGPHPKTVVSDCEFKRSAHLNRHILKKVLKKSPDA